MKYKFQLFKKFFNTFLVLKVDFFYKKNFLFLENKIIRKILQLSLILPFTNNKVWTEMGVEKIKDLYYNEKKIQYFDDVFLKIFDKYIEKNLSILDLGCSIGRHLDILSKNKYSNLSGIDLSIKATDEIKKRIPNAIIYSGDYRKFLLEHKKTYDVIYGVGSVELNHPSFNIVKHMTKMSNAYIILIFNEDNHHTRLWDYEFNNYNFVLFEKIILNTEKNHLISKGRKYIAVYKKI